MSIVRKSRYKIEEKFENKTRDMKNNKSQPKKIKPTLRWVFAHTQPNLIKYEERREKRIPDPKNEPLVEYDGHDANDRAKDVNVINNRKTEPQKKLPHTHTATERNRREKKE